jgi:hypothetical protein
MKYEIGKEYIFIRRNEPAEIVTYLGISEDRGYSLNTYYKFGNYIITLQRASEVIFEKTPLMEALL